MLLNLGERESLFNLQELLWSPDGARLYISDHTDVQAIDVTTGERVYQVDGSGAIALSPDGERLVLQSNGYNEMLMIDTVTGELIDGFSVRAGSVRTSVAWSPDGAKLSSLTENSYPGFDDATWKPDGSAFATAAYYEIVPGAGTGSVARFKTWDAASGDLLQSIEGEYEAIIDWSSDGARLAGGELKDSGVGAIKTWDAATGAEGVSFSGISGRISDVAWSPDGRYLAAGNQWGDVSVWEVATGKEMVLEGLDFYDSVHDLAWNPGSTRLAATLDSSKVKVWTLTSPSEPFTLYSDVNRFIYGLSWSPDGTKLAAGGDGRSVQIWNAVTGQELLSLAGHIGSITTLDWSSDGQFLVSGSWRAEVILWRLYFE